MFRCQPSETRTWQAMAKEYQVPLRLCRCEQRLGLLDLGPNLLFGFFHTCLDAGLRGKVLSHSRHSHQYMILQVMKVICSLGISFCFLTWCLVNHHLIYMFWWHFGDLGQVTRVVSEGGCSLRSP